MSKEEAVKILEKQGYIFGYLFGEPYVNVTSLADNTEKKVKDKVIKIEGSKLEILEDCFAYVWGWPGPDVNYYRFSRYGYNWSFDEKDLA